ncbi:MAG: Rrf2 family transcriptional regulator [Rhodoferax sp.]|nr:Rrf2 family transcriptional regulator [Rhodoferax sp.]
MQLTQWTDYSLRVLMYCAACEQRAARVTVTEIAEKFRISRNHLTKIVHDLSVRGLLETTRGRGGGLRLLQPAQAVTIGSVVRVTETDFRLVECFDPVGNQCCVSGQCSLAGVLDQALASFLKVLDQVTLADMVRPRPNSSDDGWQALVRLPETAPRSLLLQEAT